MVPPIGLLTGRTFTSVRWRCLRDWTLRSDRRRADAPAVRRLPARRDCYRSGVAGEVVKAGRRPINGHYHDLIQNRRATPPEGGQPGGI